MAYPQAAFESGCTHSPFQIMMALATDLAGRGMAGSAAWTCGSESNACCSHWLSWHGSPGVAVAAFATTAETTAASNDGGLVKA